MTKVAIHRRDFLKISSWSTGGLMLGFTVPGFSAIATTLPFSECDFFQPNAFLRIDKDGTITIFVGKQEMGQGVNTSLPMIVAEELEADFQKIKVEIAPFGTLAEGAHDTGGSMSVTGSWDELRKAGAVAKNMLVNAAAKRWNVNPGLCKAENGTIVHSTSGTSLTYGQLACDAASLPVPTEVTLKNVRDFKLIGKEQRKKNLKDILSGKNLYGIDVKIPGMLHAVVARCPVLGGDILSVDDTAAKLVPGVVTVVQYSGTGTPMNVRAGVAVVATNVWAAMKGRRALKITWNEGPQNQESTDLLFQTFKTRAKETPAKIVHTAGDVDAVKTSKSLSLEAEYAAPFLAHATMEPMNFIAEVKDGKCELWGGLQLPDWTVNDISQKCGLKKENIKVNLTAMGGGFGRRLQFDFAIEAVKIAQQLNKPVQVIWDRADDLKYDNYRPANYHHLKAKWDKSGKLLTWEHHVLSTPIEWMTSGKKEGEIPSENVGGAGKDFWYGIPNVKTAYTPLDFNIQRGWLRGVEPVQNVFAIECFIDEVARKMKKDPLQMRLDLLKGRQPFEGIWGGTVAPERLAGALELAAEKIGWKNKRPKNRFLGIAGHMFFCDSYAAHAIEIEKLGPKKFKIVRIVSTIDCGVVINPDGLVNQMEGGTVFGLGQALKNEITVKDSKVEQDSFFTYELIRFNEVPPIEVYAVKSEARPGGAGEVGVATVSPALCNALAAAGMRPRELPIKNAGYVWET
ncbi:MAG: xanthine dehydrogenase family protein molybdopterin-binding subunit [Saprospiraceae bacterium]|nr:xanthine dehydrogenase family protein molybdopterin-binding subunit [Saprospiraceae bacterium]